MGAGAFVCGEETALIASIEGKRGMPRPRPPFPAQAGLWGKPTLINNVETFANIAPIILNGPRWFRSIGTERSPGTKVFALAGKINNTGLVEVPMGTSLRQIIYEVGGGIPGEEVQGGADGRAVRRLHPRGVPGRSHGVRFPGEPGAMMGSGGLIVMDEDTCMVDVAKFFLQFTQDESCGTCVPCREGTKAMLDILERITRGEGEEDDLALLESLAETIKKTSLCGLGQTAPNPVLSTLRYFRDEYEAHVREKRCPAGVCKGLAPYVIHLDKCRGCGRCVKVCPAEAIYPVELPKAAGDEERARRRLPLYAIDPSKCIKCGACAAECRLGAILAEGEGQARGTQLGEVFAMERVRLLIDGQPVEVEPGATILEAARRIGIDIPTLCHHPALGGGGACRVCVCEVEGAKTLVAVCVCPASDGMVVWTHSKAVRDARRMMVELILAAHPQDCLACARSDTCELRRLAARLNAGPAWFRREKAVPAVDASNPSLVRDPSKCILCGRCVKVCRDVQGVAAIGYAHRGIEAAVGPALRRSPGVHPVRLLRPVRCGVPGGRHRGQGRHGPRL